ncbi:hypothetical protein [Mesorhizobium sp. BE184]|uniref:hypothetical protein n=1 Tax=Mesorhizobium sp. BE184 TaxID=2817714 RepID=UPI0028598AF9|nr:hypothetical protein [Mesorhizobium sp. BE184]MDR7034496.1 hypothetical protein [Mesorhizobium sp. BE184]
MATGFEFFARDLKVATASLEPTAINKAVAAFAKRELRRAIAEGIASPKYERFVNGRQGAAEETYSAPGAIVYEFVNWPVVIDAALAELRKRSPRRSGRFASSFIVIASGRAVVDDFTKIRTDAEIIITNFQPYVRKAETGRLGIPAYRLFTGTARSIRSRFAGAFTVKATFLDIRAGLHPSIPYKLKRSRGGRKDRQAGQPITYPAIVINPAN